MNYCADVQRKLVNSGFNLARFELGERGGTSGCSQNVCGSVPFLLMVWMRRSCHCNDVHSRFPCRFLSHPFPQFSVALCLYVPACSSLPPFLPSSLPLFHSLSFSALFAGKNARRRQVLRMVSSSLKCVCACLCTQPPDTLGCVPVCSSSLLPPHSSSHPLPHHYISYPHPPSPSHFPSQAEEQGHKLGSGKEEAGRKRGSGKEENRLNFGADKVGLPGHRRRFLPTYDWQLVEDDHVLPRCAPSFDLCCGTTRCDV